MIKAVIYARYSCDTREKRVLRDSFVNVRSSQLARDIHWLAHT